MRVIVCARVRVQWLVWPARWLGGVACVMLCCACGSGQLWSTACGLRIPIAGRIFVPGAWCTPLTPRLLYWAAPYRPPRKCAAPLKPYRPYRRYAALGPELRDMGGHVAELKAYLQSVYDADLLGDGVLQVRVVDN